MNKQQKGICPICESNNLEYYGNDIEENMISFRYLCQDCNLEGREWYDLIFIEHLNEDGSKIEPEKIPWYEIRSKSKSMLWGSRFKTKKGAKDYAKSIDLKEYEIIKVKEVRNE